MKKSIALLLALGLAVPAMAQAVQFTPKSRIIAYPHQQEAAQLLQRFMHEATGYAFPVVDGKVSKGDIVLMENPNLPEDAFKVYKNGSCVVLEGFGKSTTYAVCDFLEQEMGMDYWGGGEYDLPRRRAVEVRGRTEIPTFRYRQTSHWSLRNGKVATSDNGVDKIRTADKLYRTWYRLEEPHDLFVDNLWVHTCNRLLPASKYGKDHPEYYAFFGGERHPGSASQWCLTNPDVLEIVCGTLDSLFHANPQQDMISISQNDGSDTYCRCPSCQAVIDEEGSPSGPIIRFVNELAKRFPDKQISTLAYLFSVTPPLKTKPVSNVSIMLCDIDCRRQTALTENPSGQDFMKCLEGWSKVCNNIFLWDYGINFDNYLSPFPNLSTIRDNIQIFKNHGVKMHFSQINSTLGGDMAELRPYLVSKLMWNADAPLDSLERHFCEGYYGAAAEPILRYIHMIEGAAVATDVDLFIYDSPVSYKDNILRPALLRRYNALFDLAEEAVAHDPVKLARVRRTRLPLQYSALEIARTNPNRDFEAVGKALEVFESRIKELGIETLNERNNDPLAYCAMYRERYLKNLPGNLASGRPVSFIKGPHPRYEELARTAITDGLFGGTGYVENWVGWEGSDADFVIDLGEEKDIREVGADFLRQIGGWVLEPLGMSVLTSADGGECKPFGYVDNPENRDGTIGFKTLTVKGSAKARYVRIQVVGVKICPEWHYGVGNPCWFFTDEVWVR